MGQLTATNSSDALLNSFCEQFNFEEGLADDLLYVFRMNDLGKIPEFDQALYIRCQQKAYDDCEGQVLVLWLICEYKDCHKKMKRDPEQVPFIFSRFETLHSALEEYLHVPDVFKACKKFNLI